jgi:hypothetical protein
MGILAESSADDINALEWVVTETVQAWTLHCAKNPAEKVQIEVNVEQIRQVSDAGGLILEKKFPEPALVDRLATLLMVTTCSPLFGIKRNGKFVNNMEHRRIIIGVVGLAIIRTALRLCTPVEGAGCYTFSGVRELDRFFSFCECLDAVEITNIKGSPGSAARAEHAYNVLTKDIIGISMFIQPGIEFVPGGVEDSNCLVFVEANQLPSST